MSLCGVGDKGVHSGDKGQEFINILGKNHQNFK